MINDFGEYFKMKKMKKKILIIVISLVLAGMAGADTVQLDLLSLGCPTELNSGTSYWQTNFDLGVTFTEISHVYIDWSGGITAGLVQDYNPSTYEPVGQPYPIDAGVYASFGFPLRIEVWRGVSTYPAPESFDRQDEFPTGGTTWFGLLDGMGEITIGYTEPGFDFSGTWYVTHGSATLDKAILVVEGTVPEPASILLLAIGLAFIRYKHRVGNKAT